VTKLSVEPNDVGIFAFESFTGPEFPQIVDDQFDQLSRRPATRGWVLPLLSGSLEVERDLTAGP
jgi:hypothetical protein